VPSLPLLSTDAVPSAVAPVRTSRVGAWILFALILIGLFGGLLIKTPLRTRLLSVLLVTVAFALFARILGGVTYAGAAAGFLVTSLLFLSGGPPMFIAVLLVFVLTLTATKFGRARKQSLTIAERSGGRDGGQVLANIGISATFAALSAITPYHLPLLAGALAALAEAACDTVSSETGKALALEARLVTSGKIVPAGTNGAISLPGTMLGAIAAALVALEAVFSGLLDPRRATIVAVAGVLGMLVDSLLGATLERRGWLTNNTVNLVSTFAAALLATIAAW
jgi:uncharacterized protein (TIGR00297 family)